MIAAPPAGFAGRVLSDQLFELGEGAIYDPANDKAWWFDILGRKLVSYAFPTGALTVHDLPMMASAMALVDKDRQLIVNEDGLCLREIRTGAMARYLDIESDNPADPLQRRARASLRRALGRHDGQGRGRCRRQHLPCLQGPPQPALRPDLDPQRHLLLARRRARLFRRHAQGRGPARAARSGDRPAEGRAGRLPARRARRPAARTAQSSTPRAISSMPDGARAPSRSMRRTARICARSRSPPGG